MNFAVAESFNAKGIMPADNLALDLPAPTTISSKYVASATVNDGAITILYASAGIGGNPTMNGAKLTLTPTDNGGSLTWQCAIGGRTDLYRYLPAECRN